MPFLFYLDNAALIVISVLSAALLLLSVSAGIRSATNRCFAIFVLGVLGWGITFILMRFALVTGRGNPQPMLWVGSMLFALSSPLLFSFAVHYKKIHKPYHNLIVLAGMVVLLSMAIPMFSGRVVTDPELSANGAVIISVAPLTWLFGMVPVAYFVFASVILWRNRGYVGEAYIAVSPLLFLVGLVLDGLLSLPFPYLSLSGAIGVAVLGHGVTRRQIFNPLRREIEERRRTEGELRESEQKFRTLSEQSPNMIFINKRGKVVYANTRCQEVMGYTREEFLADEFDFRSIISPESMRIIERNFADHMAGRDVEPYEYLLVTKDGKLFDGIIHTRLIDYEGEKAILGIVTDIRNQKRTERLLKTLNLAALDLERSLQPGELVPIAHRYLRRIGYFARVFWDSEESFSFTEMMTQGTRPLSAAEFPDLEVMLKSREAMLLHQDNLLYCRITDGVNLEETSCNSAALVPFIAENQGRGFLAVLGDDINANELPPLTVFANQLAASYRRSLLMDELSASISRLKDTQDELAHAQRMEAVGRLSGGIAHDFNNILTAIHGCAELIKIELAADSDPDALRQVEEIKRAVRQASGLTQQLLAFSRKQVIERHDIELNTVIRKVENLLRRVIGEDITFSLELRENLGTVSIDERQFEQVLMNLGVNARDAMPHGGRIIVRTFKRTVGPAEASEREFKPGAYCVLTFTDTGIGMDSETRRRVFEPFFTTKEFGKGTGLGMSTVYGIIRQCDGYIVVESEPERGTTYIIYLPETAGKASEVVKVVRQQDPVVEGGETVLVVEDDETVRTMVRRTLEKYNYTVLTASDAVKAVDMCLQEACPIDVVLTDVVMPGGKNGFELADWLAMNYPKIKVMYMSGYADEAAAAQEAIRQNSAFLKKPFSAKALLETLREVCDGNAVS